jgi:NAD(P)-dependent dehydrogenase (short-subunit alcohol dehydrogenase family)
MHRYKIGPTPKESAVKIEKLFDVTGKSVVITGGASGIGLAMAKTFLENGASVTILDMNEAALATQRDQLAALGQIEAVIADITDSDSIDRALAQAADKHGGIDAIFANAGTEAGIGFLATNGTRPEEGAFENVRQANWEKVIAVNLTGAMLTARAAVPYMKKQGGGRIIITSSIASTAASPIATVGYCASKAGVSHFVKRLAIELAKYNILVNEIAPGGVLTNINNGMWEDPDVIKLSEAATPLHRIAQPDDLVGIAIYLASPASSYVTGSRFVVDGGLTLGMAD